MASTTEREEWARYRATGDIEARNRLVERHVGLVYHFARRMSGQSGDLVDRDDLVGAGTVGLLTAVESYDPGRGHRFSTYAGPRIRGSMLDELRRRDHAPRSVRRRQRAMARASERLAVSLDRTPAHGDVARVLGVDAKTLWRWKWDVSRARNCSLDDASWQRALGVVDGTEDRLTRETEVTRLRRELGELGDRERLVIELYDMRSWTLRRIAGRLGVTESRVSQIRTAALRRLRTRMQDLREAA